MQKKIFLRSLPLLGAAVILFILAVVSLHNDTPAPAFEAVKETYRISDALLLDRHGQVIHELRMDPTGRRLAWTALMDISPSLVRVVIHAEDRNFYEHRGVDWGAVGAAAISRLAGRAERGASTITMQLAARLEKGLRPQVSRRTFREKWRQIRAARQIERSWTKAQILEGYLNLITFRGEVQGIAAAARGFFDKEPGGLNENESLILASLIPSTRSSLDHVSRRACRLANSLGIPTPSAEISALVHDRIGQPYRIRPQIALAPHVARMVLKESGTRVKTTLDGRLQQRVSEVLRHHLGELSNRNAHDGAVLVVENATGDILAYAGSGGPSSSAPHVDGVRALRQAGSTLKPFLYGLALEKQLLTAASIVDDAPLQITTPTGLYMPENYGRDYLGPVSVRTALSASLNTPAVRTLLLVGVAPFVERLQRLGFCSIRQSPDYYGYSAALGSIDISLYELANAYRTLANGGEWSALRIKADDHRGAPRRRMSRDAVFILSHILADREARSATFGMENFLATRFWTGVKTGTSKDMRDNWCLGYSEKYTVGVWIGNFSGEPMWNVTGISGAAPVWLEIMNDLHAFSPSRMPKPTPGVLAGTVRFKGALEPERPEWFIRGTEPDTPVARNARHEKPRILYPAEGSILSLDPDIPEENQSVAFESRPAGVNFEWFLDGRSIARETAGPFFWKLERGTHVLSIANADRQVLDSVTFVVR